jgi:hypothetical protein
MDIPPTSVFGFPAAASSQPSVFAPPPAPLSQPSAAFSAPSTPLSTPPHSPYRPSTPISGATSPVSLSPALSGDDPRPRYERNESKSTDSESADFGHFQLPPPDPNVGCTRCPHHAPVMPSLPEEPPKPLTARQVTLLLDRMDHVPDRLWLQHRDALFEQHPQDFDISVLKITLGGTLKRTWEGLVEKYVDQSTGGIKNANDRQAERVHGIWRKIVLVNKPAPPMSRALSLSATTAPRSIPTNIPPRAAPGRNSYSVSPTGTPRSLPSGRGSFNFTPPKSPTFGSAPSGGRYSFTALPVKRTFSPPS